MGSVKLNRFLEFMNSKERKELQNMLRDQFGIDELPDYEYLRSNKDKVYVLSPGIREVDYTQLRIDRAGLYFGKFYADGFRPSLEGAVILGPMAKHHVVDIPVNHLKDWLAGRDLPAPSGENAFVFVRCEGDFYGACKMKNGELRNSLSKSRKSTSLLFQEES